MKKINVILTIIAIILIFTVITISYLYMKEKNNFNETLNKSNEKVEIDVEINDSVRKLLSTYIKEYEYFENNKVGTFPDILRKLNLETEENLKKLVEDNFHADGNFKTNVKYEEFKNAMLKMITEKYFNEKFSNYTNIDGYVSVNNGAGEYFALELEDLECIFYDDNTNTYIYNVKVKDMEVYDHYQTDSSFITLEECYMYFEITLKKVNDHIVIDDIIYKPNNKK